MVGHLTLDEQIGVRIRAPPQAFQPEETARYALNFFSKKPLQLRKNTALVSPYANINSTLRTGLYEVTFPFCEDSHHLATEHSGRKSRTLPGYIDNDRNSCGVDMAMDTDCSICARSV